MVERVARKENLPGRDWRGLRENKNTSDRRRETRDENEVERSGVSSF